MKAITASSLEPYRVLDNGYGLNRTAARRPTDQFNFYAWYEEDRSWGLNLSPLRCHHLHLDRDHK